MNSVVHPLSTVSYEAGPEEMGLPEPAARGMETLRPAGHSSAFKGRNRSPSISLNKEQTCTST